MVGKNEFIRFLITFFPLLLLSTEISAMPSFARQTGLPCSSCHVQSFGPNLTPIGRNFKLNGYTGGDNTISRMKYIPPISAQLRGSFTHTQRSQPGGAADRYNANDNATIDEASVFYAGRIYSKVGAFVQGSYGGVEDKWELDNADIRIADNNTIAGQHFVYGISTNNSPAVSDLWNTTPVWGFPYASSDLAPTPAAGALIESLGSQVVGATAYMMWNNLLYIEAGGYTSLPKNIQKESTHLMQNKTELMAARPIGGSHFKIIGKGTMVR